jgi:hypothetical protein
VAGLVTEATGEDEMARINYSDEEDTPGQFALWNANVQRSIAGKQGQWTLRELEAALLALPRPRLVRNMLADDGDCCAVGCLVLALRVKQGEDRAAVLAELEDSDPDDDEAAQAMAEPLGIPHLVGWKLVELNDIQLDTVWEVADGPIQRGHGVYRGGVPLIREMTPEERYDKVLAWVRSHLR